MVQAASLGNLLGRALNAGIAVASASSASRPQTARQNAEMTRLQQTNFPEYARQLAPTLSPQDRANPFAYSLDHSIPIEVKRQVFADYQSGRNAPRVEISSMAGSNASYTENAGPNGTIRINSDLLANNDPSRRGQMEAFAVWGHMEEVGHWADARAQQLMGNTGGDSLGDEGARYAYLEMNNVTANANPATFLARYDIAASDGTVRNVMVDTVVLRALAAEKVANGSMARENRIGDVENFGPEGHYQTTYITAFAAAVELGMRGPEVDRLANQMALGSQLPDMLANYDAVSQAEKKGKDFAWDVARGPSALLSPSWTAAEQRHLESVYEGLHALPRDNDATKPWLNNERAKTRAYIVDRITNGDYLTAGIAIHRYGDLHAHVQPSGVSYSGDFGHGFERSTPDYLYTENRQGQAVRWTKATSYQASLASTIAEGLAGHERSGGRQISSAMQNAASEYARSSWRVIYDSALVQAAAGPKKNYSAQKATEIYFRNLATTSINTLHNAVPSANAPLSIRQMDVDGGFVANRPQINSLETVMNRFDAQR
jgi:hypothetical protein